MKLWRDGDRSKGVCDRCKKVVETRFVRRAVTLEKPKVVVPDVLVAACAECDETVAIPAQSSPRLRQARQHQAKRVEARIPMHLQDVLGLIAGRYEARQEEFATSLLRYYLRLMSRQPGALARIVDCSRCELATGPADSRLSLRIDPAILEAAWTAARGVGVRFRTDLIRGAIVAAAVDAGLDLDCGLQVRPSPECRKAQETIASVTSLN